MSAVSARQVGGPGAPGKCGEELAAVAQRIAAAVSMRFIERSGSVPFSHSNCYTEEETVEYEVDLYPGGMITVSWLASRIAYLTLDIYSGPHVTWSSRDEACGEWPPPLIGHGRFSGEGLPAALLTTIDLICRGIKEARK